MPRVPNPSSAGATAGGESTAGAAPVAAEPVRRVAPVSFSHPFEPMEQTIGQDVERKMSSTGPAAQALEPAYIQPVDRPVDPEKLAMMAFMEELVEVQIHTTTDPEAEQVFDIGNNGQREFFRRGETKTCRRKFVQGLASAKMTTYTQERRRGEDGIMYDVQVPRTGLRYPFTVTRDDHPRGRDWITAVLAQA